ncbi:MAG: hypothetical protein JXA49_10790, partial [Actinobacteria bacterium]|nr:hypothetical protein [Actinomycetota bacterium]
AISHSKGEAMSPKKKEEYREEESEDISREDLEKMFAEGEPAVVAPTPKDATSSLFTIRIDTDILGMLREVAKKEGVSTSALARRFLIEGLEGSADMLSPKDLFASYTAALNTLAENFRKISKDYDISEIMPTGKKK